MASTYGRRVPTWENEDIKEIYSIVQEFGDVTRPGTWLAETIPPLADLPAWMQWWRPAALKYQDHQSTSPKTLLPAQTFDALRVVQPSDV